MLKNYVFMHFQSKDRCIKINFKYELKIFISSERRNL